MSLSDVSEARKLSVEYEELDAAQKSRYTERKKLITDDAVYSYLVTGEVGCNLSSRLPLIEYPDVINLFITAPSTVTKDELMAFKSLEGCKCHPPGRVGSVAIYEVSGNTRKNRES